MKFQIDHDLHIHSYLSTCSSDPGETPDAILRYGEQNGMTTLCLTDHFWDCSVHSAGGWYRPQDFTHISLAKPLPQGKRTRFYFGCETELHQNLELACPPERFDDFDFIIIPTTHLGSVGLTITEEDHNDLDRNARVWVERLENILDRDDLPFSKIGIAHLACPLINKEHFLEVLDRLQEDDLERLFAKAATRGCGIELNAGDFLISDADADRVARIFRVAKSKGCKFYLGSDAHHPADLERAPALFARAIDLLDLTEDDKFHPALPTYPTR